MNSKSDTIDAEIDKLIQDLGDICHESYLGCSKNTSAPDGFEYSYSNEVINLLDTPEVKAKLQALLLREREKETKLLDALYWMYTQYCGNGHDFMNAGEDASEILENAGYITVDGAGRILKDFGDSSEQLKNSKASKQ